jgi:hypothetical protein
MCNDAIAAALLYGVADPRQRLATLTGDRVGRSFGWRNITSEKWKIVAAPHELTPRSSRPGEFPCAEQRRHRSFILCRDSANDGSSAVRRYATLQDHFLLRMQPSVCGFQDGRSCGGGSCCFPWSKRAPTVPAVVKLQGHDPRHARAQSSWMRHGGLQWMIQTPCARVVRPGKVHLAPFDSLELMSFNSAHVATLPNRALPAIGVATMYPLECNSDVYDGPRRTRSPCGRTNHILRPRT